MPTINNYGSLKIELTGTLFHSRFVNNYDRATQTFETIMNRTLRVRPMETSTLLTTVNGEVALPPDYLLWRTIRPASASSALPVLPFDEINYVHPAYLPPAARSIDRVFTIEGNIFKARPVDDRPGAWELHYYQKIPSIIGNDNNSNWLLNEQSDVYLEGVLTELFILGRNFEAAMAHKQLRDAKLTEVISLYSLTTGASSPTVRTAEYF